MTAKLSVLALTEDSSSQAAATFRALLKRTFVLIDEATQTQPSKLAFMPPDVASEFAARAQRWRSSRVEDQRFKVALVRSIATQLAQASGFVFFHVDGDEVWSARTVDLRAHFDREVVQRVRQLLMSLDSETDRTTVDAWLSKLHLAVPYYSIEAWLYQNAPVAIALCRSRYQGQDIEKFQAWAADRAAVDEVPQIKRKTCLDNKHNQELAETTFPAVQVEAVGTSYAAFVRDCRASEALVAALASTHAWAP
jgi:hypothetical protein